MGHPRLFQGSTTSKIHHCPNYLHHRAASWNPYLTGLSARRSCGKVMPTLIAGRGTGRILRFRRSKELL